MVSDLHCKYWLSLIKWIPIESHQHHVQNVTALTLTWYTPTRHHCHPDRMDSYP